MHIRTSTIAINFAHNSMDRITVGARARNNSGAVSVWSIETKASKEANWRKKFWRDF